MSTTSNNQSQSTATNRATSQAALSADDLRLFKELDRGRLFRRLTHLQKNAVFIPPTEMYLLLDPASVSTTVEQHLARGASFWGRCRNICVLVPLLLTWFGLSTASELYEQTIVLDRKQIEQPFLKMWIEGFPSLHNPTLFGYVPLPPFLIHFSGIAAIDACLLPRVNLSYLAYSAYRVKGTEESAYITWLGRGATLYLRT